MPKSAARAEKIDLYKLNKAEYAATKDPKLIEVGPASYVTIDGRGEPGGADFQSRLGSLYAVAYTIKMAKKFAGEDYKVCGLEGLWWCADPKNWMDQPRDSWQWKLMIRVPGFITEADLKAAVEQAVKKGKGERVAEVRLENISEGRCVQALHVGPYSTEPETLARMDALVESEGLSYRDRHHEIYLSDPRRVPPERLRTILRHPVA